MKLVAITGSIGCGKTTIARLANELGYSVYDIDGWVRRLYYKQDFLEVIMDNFPKTFKDRIFNKRKLREVVFSDDKKLKKLEEIIHPFLHKNLKEVIRADARKDFIYFIDVALLFEMGWDKYADLIIVADAPYEIQKKRVMQRDNVTAEHFDEINNIQMKNTEKIEKADVVIDTNKPLNLIKLDLINIIDRFI